MAINKMQRRLLEAIKKAAPKEELGRIVVGTVNNDFKCFNKDLVGFLKKMKIADKEARKVRICAR